MATLYKEGVEGKYKWLTPKQAKKYGIPPEYKLMEETVLSHLAKILQKTGAKPSVVYSLFTDETGCKRIRAFVLASKTARIICLYTQPTGTTIKFRCTNPCDLSPDLV